MTAQFNDLFVLDGKEYQLSGISDGELFSPGKLGIQSGLCCTACWRGYIATFGLLADRLVLSELLTSFDTQDAPTINGVSPSKVQRPFLGFTHRYENANLDLDYSGGLLVTNGFIQELYIHMGFHPAWKYREVIELVFDNGRLVAQTDRSDVCDEIRKRMADKGLMKRLFLNVRDSSLESFIDKAFERTYSLK